MHKSLISKIFILLLVVGLLFAVAPTKQAQAATLDVCPSGCTYTTIQAAINAAADNDTISVGPGTYNEALMINKPLTVQSTAGAATTIISKDVIYVVSITASNVTFDGFTVMSPGFADPGADLGGIMIGYYGDNSLVNIVVKNNIVTQIGAATRVVSPSDWPSVGICVNGVINGLQIKDNIVHDITQVVNDNSVTWGPTGIAFYGYDTTPLSQNVIISGNQVYNIGFTGTSTGTIANGIRAGWGSGDVTMSGNTIHDINGRAIAVTSSNNGVATITNNVISNAPTGIYLFNAGGGVLSGNTFTNVTTELDTPPVHNVTKGTYYATIQDAVAASAAGNVINVAAGTYNIGTLVVPHPLSIIGVGDTTLVNGKFQLTNANSVAGTYLFQAMNFPVTNSSITVTDVTNVIDEVKIDNVTFDTNTDTTARAIGVGPDSVSYRIRKFTVLNSRFYSTLAIYLTGDIGEILIDNNDFHATGLHWSAYNAININQSVPASASVNPAGTFVISNNEVFVPGTPYASAITNQAYPGSALAGQPGGKELSATSNTITVASDTPITDQSLFVKDLIAVANATFKVHNVTQNIWYSTIQAAINAANPGNVIDVTAGTYNENLTINKALTLTGAGAANTIVNGVAPVADGGSVTIQASGVTIQGFKFVGAGNQTVRLTGTALDLVFTNNTVVGFDAATPVSGSTLLMTNTQSTPYTSLSITNNTFVLNGQWMAVYLNPNFTNLTFTNNIFTGDPTLGPVVGLDGLTGGETFTGNDFSAMTSTYALFETFGPGSLPTPVAPYFTGNTWPAGYFPIGNMVKIPDTKLLMDPAAFVTTDTCTGSREVTVKVQAVSNMAAYQLYLAYNANLITVTNVENVSPIAGAAAPDNTFANGVIRFGWYPPTGGGNPPTYNGDQSLIKITFTTKGLAGTGAFTIQPTSMLLSWPDAVETPYEITGGSTFDFGSIVTNTQSTVATTDDVSYCDLALAVGEADPNDTLRVDANITSNVSITVDKALTLDTNGKTISRTVALSPSNNSFVVAPGGDLTITGAGTITTTSGNAIRIEGNETTQAKVTLQSGHLYGPNASVVIIGNRSFTAHEPAYKSLFEMTGGNTDETVLVLGNGAEANISGGTLIGWAPIMGNGTVDAGQNINNGGTKITIGGTDTTITGTNGSAIYHPQDGLLTINGGTISGVNGIEMKAGDLVVTGGEIRGTGQYFDVSPYDDGSVNTGDAILLNGRNAYTGDITVDISGGTITSTNAYALRDFSASDQTLKTSNITIDGGTFRGATGKGAVTFSDKLVAANAAGTANLDLLPGSAYNIDPGATPDYVYSPYISYLDQVDHLFKIAGEPVITSSDIQGYYLVGEQREFSVSLTNPTTGGAYTDVMFKITIPNASLANLNNIDFYEEGWGPDGYPKWYDMHFAQVGTDLVGWYGGIFYGGFPLPADGIVRPGTLRVDFATPGTYTVNLELFTVTGIDSYADNFDYKEEAISLLATKTFTMNVYDAPTVSVVTDPYFIVNEAGNFSVTIANPSTGRNYGNNVVFDLVIPGHLPADFGAMSCSFGTTTWPVTLLPDGLGGSYTRIGGLDGFFDITAPFGPMTVNCTVTYLAAGTYNVTGKMTDTLATTDLTDDRVIQTGVGTVVAYTKPTIVPTFPTDPIFAGVPVSVPVIINNPSQLADPFDLVITVPAGTVITAEGYTVVCSGTTCTITVDLVDPALYPVTLPLMFTFPAAVTPDISFNLYDLDWIGTDDRLLATFTKEDLAIGSGYTVSGTITMQGRPGVLNGIPVTLYWDSTFATYGPSMETDTLPVNFHLAVTYGGTYKFTTLQPRFLNITAEMLKTFTVAGNKTINSLWMRAGNAVWRGVNLDETWNGLYDNTINGADSSLVGTMYGSTGAPNTAGNSGDVNFDNIVNIKDLTLVGGNMGLNSETAYAETIWMP